VGIGVVLVVVGVVLMLIPMVKAVRGQDPLGRARKELEQSGLSARELRTLRQRLGTPDQDLDQDLPQLRMMARDTLARRAGLWFCVGATVAAFGLALPDLGNPVKLGFFVVVLVVMLVSARSIERRAQNAATFLALHPS
jgi:hypothetical protein